GEPGELNRSLVSAARFLNMHAQAGVPAENMSLAFVIHGKAVHDVTVDAHYSQETDTTNANADLIKALVSQGVTIEVCGQSAAYYGVGVGDLLPGVTMSLSAMTSHAILQQKGYTLNPF
ncbi:MAG: DsrE family protein, partial [Pseudomonadota bacterium]